MARQRIDWGLDGAKESGIISLKEEEVSIPKEKGSKEKVKGKAIVIDRINEPAKFRELAEAAYNKGKKDTDKVSLTYEWLLAEFVNSSLRATKRNDLKAQANPDAAVTAALANLRKKFPHLTEEQLLAMHAMLKSGMTA